MFEIRAMTSPRQGRFLIETLLYHDGFRFLDEHMNRMRAAARHFDIPFNEGGIWKGVRQMRPERFGNNRYKIRITASFEGLVSVEATLIEPEAEGIRLITISPRRVNSADEHLYFKTSERTLYESEYQRISGEGLYEVLFLNEEGHVTEGSRSNVIIQKEASLITPPVSAGLLNGIYRQQLLLRCDTLYEDTISPEDLYQADAIYVCNSVRGLRKVTLAMI